MILFIAINRYELLESIIVLLRRRLMASQGKLQQTLIVGDLLKLQFKSPPG